MKTRKWNRLSHATLLASAIAVPQAATSMALEEVVVTAQKRAESAQDIPVAITAVGSETIENMGLQTFSDLTKISPSLTISETDNRNQSPISLRGIGTYSFSIGTEPSVAVVIDDIPVARSGGAFSNLMDIERIEVLRGPQSTLFGKNASAGVINIVTKAPSEEFEGSVQMVATDDDELRTMISGSGMLTDNLGVRIGAYYSDREGHIENLTTGEDLNGSQEKGIRAKFLWNMTDSVTATVIGEYNESEDNCCAATFRSLEPGANLFGISPASEFLEGINPSKTNHKLRIDGPALSESADWMTSLKLEAQVGDHSLVSITGYRDWKYDWATDLDSVDTFSLNQGGPYETELFTQELRLVSPVSDSLEYVAGLYYAKTESTRGFNRFPIFLASWKAETESELMSVFGQATFGLAENLKLIAGLRLQNEEVSVGFVGNACGEEGCAGSDDENAVTGKLALQYFVNDDVMVFGGYSKGYKGQTYDITSSFSQALADNPVLAEESDAYELGVKSTLFEGRMQINLVAFYSEYSDFQAQSGVTEGFDTILRLNNVGELETKGLELDGIALLGENFRMTFGASFIEATMASFKGAQCYPYQTTDMGCFNGFQDLSGEDMSNTPEFKFNVGADLDLPLDSMPFDGFFNFSYQYQDDVNFDLKKDPMAVQEAYGIFNLSFGVVAKDERESYRFTFFVNNLFDEDFVSNIQTLSFYGVPASNQFITRGAERYMGIRAKFNF